MIRLHITQIYENLYSKSIYSSMKGIMSFEYRHSVFSEHRNIRWKYFYLKSFQDKE